MPMLIDSDAHLARLNKERDHVKEQMRVAWAQPSPDMRRLEALHYELKNVEYRISTHRPEKKR
jgi:hypothetical protein